MRTIRTHETTGLIADVLESIRRSDLIWSLAYFKIATKTRNALLGVLWNVLGFALFVFGIALLWGVVFKLDREDFVPYVALGYLVFQMITGTMLDSSRAISDGGNFALQNRIPLTMLPFVYVAKQCLTALFALPTIALALLLYPPDLSAELLLLVPGFILCVFTFSGLAVILAIICVYIADLAELLSAVMRFMFFLTPIIWVAEDRSGLDMVLMLNPLHHAINVVRGPVLELSGVAFSFGYMLALFVTSWTFAFVLYHRLSRGLLLRV